MPVYYNTPAPPILFKRRRGHILRACANLANMEQCVSQLQRPRRYLTVEPATFLFMFATFLSYPTYQQLLYSTLCDHNCSTSQNSTCNKPSSVQLHYQSETSHWILYTNLAKGIPTILVSLVYGSLSDLLGRRLFIILPAVGAALNSVVVLLVFYIAPKNISLYLIGAVLSGVTGGFSAFNFAVYSYAADNSNHDNRTQRIGWLEAMTYFGSTLSGLVSGVWIKYQGFGPPYFGILACHITIIFYVILFLPSSTSSNHQTRVKGSVNTTYVTNINITHVCTTILVAVVTKLYQFGRLFLNSCQLVTLFAVFFVLEINFLGIVDTVVLYGLTRLCWGPDFVGYFLASKSFVSGLAASLILPLLTYCGVKDILIAVIGIISGAAALAVMGVATHTWIMFLAVAIGIMRGCVVPVVRAMLSKLTPGDQQGVLFAGISIIEASCMLVASSLYNAIFPITYKIYPGLCFFIMASTLIIILPFLCVPNCTDEQYRLTPHENTEKQSLLN